MKKLKTIRQYEYFSCHGAKSFVRFTFILMIFLLITTSAKSQYLSRTLSNITEVKMDVSSPTAHYKPIFGSGDNNSSIIKAVSRYGNLTIDPMGSSGIVKYADEEVIIFVLDGTGTLMYGKEKVPVSKNDFIYIPVGTRFGFSNPRERPLSVIVMGFKIFPGTVIKPTTKLMIANADEVPFQILGSHGPTTQFQLLMGTTNSTRDRLSAAYQATSLFVMDFNVSGTNIPHKHKDEEEIYFILRGQGDIVAGEKSDSTEFRHPSKTGDAYFFSPNTLIGFYSGNKDGEEHARILAIRFKYPAPTKGSSEKK
jgi:mannose-6-phosphate isomerase-like protein (cupin superfamily)